MSTNTPSKALKQFRIMAIAEGFSWLGLLVTMYLKYGQNMPEPNQWVGMIHGILFIGYCLYIAYFYFEEKWNLIKCLVLFLTAFLPFGTFWAERKYLR
jgi:integral membrane protein